MVQYKSAISITVLVLIVLFSGCIGVEDITPVNNSTSNSTDTKTSMIPPASTVTSTPTLTATMTPTVTPTSTVTPTPQITPVATTISTIPVPVADQKTFTNSIGVEFILIPAGEFEMGNDFQEFFKKLNENEITPITKANFEREEPFEGPVHHVTLAKAFYMGKYEVTQKQWHDVMGTNPSYFLKGDSLPVVMVSWNDVQEFIKKLNENESTDKYRLPSEAEWEYSARAGTTTIFSFGDDASELGDYAWYVKNSNYTMHPVGQKKSNPWGLYDMHGNVWEWVQDKWHATYDGAPIDGSAWESGNGNLRTERGGNWKNPEYTSRSGKRVEDPPDGRYPALGFRLVRDL